MKSRKSATRVAASALGVYVGLLGALHGYFEILQGDVAPDGLMINAIGPPCQPEEVGHACFPAMTLVPNFLVTGILAEGDIRGIIGNQYICPTTTARSSNCWSRRGTPMIRALKKALNKIAIGWGRLSAAF